MSPVGTLAGKTVLVTGASRGIGKAIALRAAKDGANVVIIAKTGEPHPKLPGTVYSVAKEVEAAGGKALPCVLDVRDESLVAKAVEDAVSRFGGIDILVNNASSIALSNTPATDMKRYDLLQGVNARGTYLMSRTCLPYLTKAPNAHILNISPPINLAPHWFSGHLAYTMSKYGMSMCALGMALEFKPLKIAVNALWPQTAILTAAMELLAGGHDAAARVSRKVEIMSDAAHIILTKDSASYTGNFVTDEGLLKSEGVVDFDQYAVDPKYKDQLMPDGFLDIPPEKMYAALRRKK